MAAEDEWRMRAREKSEVTGTSREEGGVMERLSAGGVSGARKGVLHKVFISGQSRDVS